MTIHTKKKLLAGLACWLVFTGILVAVVTGQGWVREFDRIGYAITHPVRPWKTGLLNIITTCGDPFVIDILTFFLVLLLVYKRRFRQALWVDAIQYVGYLLVIGIKYSVLRVRPIHRLVNVGGYSFPSGHTFATSIFMLTILSLVWPVLKKRWQRYLLVIAVISVIALVMLSRVYLRAHFPTDVTAGLLLALGWWFLFIIFGV
ncbi:MULTISPECIES: phosphatase PAP2 family protein [Limosilactobacillus]|uniref:PAP2 family protein n=1 Tax=Limosilactobacillus panis DSM 6035 TaxID=1423782 RepID=A0A0R1X4A7_9LACO|nr:phosphatase PAP2 family protein [Limosilactobacillus panis]KRM24962.1 PAP2 family protein [Limosilactobacillus panis DSM 6035]